MAKTVQPMQPLARILTEHGPLHIDEIGQRLREAGVAEPDIPSPADIEMECPARELVDERWAWLPAVLAGRVFTHRLGADEVAHDMLAVSPDLDPITALCEHDDYQRLVDGSAVEVVLAEFDDELLEERGIPFEAVDPGGALLLQPGTLTGLQVTEGDLVGLRLTEQGLTIERVTAPVPHAEVGARLAAVLDDDEPRLFDQVVWTACVEDPAAFTEPLAPLSEIADGCGLTRRGEWLAPAGFDFARWDFERGCARLVERHDIDPDDAVAVYTLVQLHEQVSLGIDAAGGELHDQAAPRPTDDRLFQLLGKLGAALADPLLAELLVDETIGSGCEGAAGLALLAAMLEPEVPRPAQVAFRWLRAVALERLGAIDAAERELLAAESMDPDWPLPLLDLARFASDRGDVEHGLGLLRRAGVDGDYPLFELLQQYRAEPRSGLGRNEPCWCGSGRKYKKCHLGRERLPLAERARWLYAKAVQHALLSGWNDLLITVGYERSRHAGDPDALERALGDPLVIDAVLFEGGAFAEFLEMRGSLLPDDERLLAEQWLLVERSVFDVEQAHPGQGVTVRDVRTGDRHAVRERTASRQLEPGQLICTRVLPAGDTMLIFGGIDPVALHERDALIDLLDTQPDPVTLVAWLSRRFAPPTLVNTEGDPLTLCKARVRVSDPAGIQAALDDTYDRVDGDGPQWFELVITDGVQRIRATLALDGDTLRVETNSEERMERVLATLARLDPAMNVLDDERRPMRDMRQVARLAEELPDADPLEPADPKVAAALEEFIRDYETRWLDEPIPALDGHTPREAADDPTRRGDLIKLLDGFPAGPAAGGGMDADRLRAALGLR